MEFGGDLSACAECGVAVATVTPTGLEEFFGGTIVALTPDSKLIRKDESEVRLAIGTAGGFECPACGCVNVFRPVGDPSLS